jgi:hypothetical protein
MIATASPNLQAGIRRLAGRPHSFFAVVRGAAPTAVSTLSAIDWKNETTVVHGRVSAPLSQR